MSISAERRSAPFPIDVCVVDNASGDYPEVSRAIEQYGWTSWVTLIEAPRNGGFGYGNNIAIWHARRSSVPTYIYLLNPDTEVRPGTISVLVEFLEGHPLVGIAGSGFENSDGSDWPIAFRFPSLRSEFCHSLDIGFISKLFKNSLVARAMSKTAQPTDWVSGASMMVRSTVFDRIGGFDENYFLYFEETDFSYRARQVGIPTWYVPAGVVMHISGYSTHVTSHTERKMRLPGYWFESRRRYFVLTKGMARAKFIDLVALVTFPIGWIKRAILWQRHRAVPSFFGDLWHHSILRQANQAVPAATTELHS